VIGSLPSCTARYSGEIPSGAQTLGEAPRWRRYLTAGILEALAACMSGVHPSLS